MSGGAWQPLQRPAFRVIWGALLTTQLVTWMHTVGAVSVLNGLDGSKVEISLVQTAIGLPAVLFGLLAGAAGDLISRKLIVLCAQALAIAAVGAMAFVVAAGEQTASITLGLTFVLGTAVAVLVPNFQALVQDTVPREEVAQSVTLNAVAVNASRAIGPALAGVVAAVASAQALFGLEAAIIAGAVVLVAFGLRGGRPQGESEQFGGALRAGVRFARFSRPFRVVLLRTFLFVLGGGALWALLAVVAVRTLDLGDGGLGALYACLGGGAILGTALLPRLRARFGVEQLIAIGSVGLAGTLAALAVVRSPVLAGVVLVPGGIAWICVLATINTVAQLVAPAWVRARLLGMYQVVFQGTLALCGLLWGVVAQVASTEAALFVPAGILLAGIGARRLWHFDVATSFDARQKPTWPDPALELEPVADREVLVTLEWLVDAPLAAEFRDAMPDLRRVRRQDGATAWSLWEDAARPGRYLETFRVASWAEHLRQHERLTASDAEVSTGMRRFDSREEGPVVTHLLRVRRDV